MLSCTKKVFALYSAMTFVLATEDLHNSCCPKGQIMTRLNLSILIDVLRCVNTWM